MGQFTLAPRNGVLGAAQIERAGDAGHDTIAVSDYTTEAPARISRSLCPLLVTWFRCPTCLRGFFAAGAPGPQSCPA
jgi:hypothetical protein